MSRKPATQLTEGTAMLAQCQCHYSAQRLKQAIETAQQGTGKYPQQYVVVDGEYQLIFTACGGLWDHTATDRLIDLVMGPTEHEVFAAAKRP